MMDAKTQVSDFPIHFILATAILEAFISQVWNL